MNCKKHAFRILVPNGNTVVCKHCGKVTDRPRKKTAAEKADMSRRRTEDFDFMVLCAAKGNMGMYELLRDRTLNDKETS